MKLTIFAQKIGKLFCHKKPNLSILSNRIVHTSIWTIFGQSQIQYRFSAFWLRSKCSICSYQLNIWYEVHVTSSILNLFLSGDGMSGACSGSITSWPCIAVPQGLAHFPIISMIWLNYHGGNLSLASRQINCDLRY